MDIGELQIGTKLELEPVDKNGKKLDYILISEFEWLVDSNTAMVAAPFREGAIYPIRIGTHLNVYFTHKTGSEYELFSFKATVTGREMHENIALLRISIAGEIEKIQRRDFYRLECSIPVKYRVVENMNELAIESIAFNTTIANNLSGGGICLLLEHKLDAGVLVECEIETIGKKGVKFFGKVIRYEDNDIEGRFKYQAGIEFVSISDSDREAVVRYIFIEQRKLRKKGLI